jgi:hypothetical protein
MSRALRAVAGIGLCASSQIAVVFGKNRGLGGSRSRSPVAETLRWSMVGLIGGDRYQAAWASTRTATRRRPEATAGRPRRPGGHGPRGRPREAFVDPVVRRMRQTGNPNIGVAEMARMKINYYKRREKTYERNWLDRAVVAGDGEGGCIIDAGHARCHVEARSRPHAAAQG